MLIGFVAALNSGCASIMHGPMQNVSVTSTPEGADAHFKPIAPVSRVVSVKTPGTVSLYRRHAYDLTVEKAGYEPKTTQLKQGIDIWVLGNAVFGGLIGAFIDSTNGSAMRLKPKKVHVDLKPVEA